MRPDLLVFLLVRQRRHRPHDPVERDPLGQGHHGVTRSTTSAQRYRSARSPSVASSPRHRPTTFATRVCGGERDHFVTMAPAPLLAAETESPLSGGFARADDGLEPTTF